MPRHVCPLRSGVLLQTNLEATADEEKLLPRCYSKWSQLSAKILGNILAALGLEQLDAITLASMSKCSDRTHLLLYALKLPQDARLPRKARSLDMLCTAAVERYNAAGRLLDGCWGLAAASESLL